MNIKIIGKQKKEKLIINSKVIESTKLMIIAGPCSVESREQIFATAKIVKECGGTILRGGAFKPRTSPYSFSGLGLEGLMLLKKAGEEHDLPVISEVMDTRNVELMSKYVDILQVGSRNMQNYSLLSEVGKSDKPVLLKRGMSATIEEWLLAAEYIALEGNSNIILCERGIRTFEKYTRNTLDLSAVPIVKSLTSLPILVDPSHGTGVRHLVPPMANAAIAAGANGIMVEIHPNPESALSDGEQSLTFEEFRKLMKQVRGIHNYMTKNL
ncbi:MAG: 3-deoxy-7-phosphoheptulonate synthase [Alkaliphilus sp.]|nr:MAG: 3-deoxy-7-phosphoheptulonate synthase [Alkaliphilus sp.]